MTVRFSAVPVKDGDLARVQSTLAEVLLPVTTSRIIDGILMDSQSVTTSFQNLPHGLGRKPVGWFVVAPNADARVWADSDTNNPDVTKFIRVKASAAVTCKFWVF